MVTKSRKGLIELAEELNHYESNSINGKHLTALLKKEFGALQIKILLILIYNGV